MISNPNTAPADAYAPDADRAGPAMPENIARLLYVLRVLLDAGRHLAATMERRATAPGFWIYSGVFGTAKVPVILAHLRRAILRAATLESLLLARAAAGRDVAPAPLPTCAAPAADANADPCEEPFAAQVARLAAERARHDAPVDPDKLATAEQIEAEVRARPIGGTIDEIRRDLGIVAAMCTSPFWGALTDAIACYRHSTAVYLEDTAAAAACSRQEQAQETAPGIEPPPEQVDQAPCTPDQRRVRRASATHVIARSEATKQSRSEEPLPRANLDDRDCAPLVLLAITLCCASLIPIIDLNTNRYADFKRGKRTADPFRHQRALARPRRDVPGPNRRAAMIAAATGPPPRVAMNLAA